MSCRKLIGIAGALGTFRDLCSVLVSDDARSPNNLSNLALKLVPPTAFLLVSSRFTLGADTDDGCTRASNVRSRMDRNSFCNED